MSIKDQIDAPVQVLGNEIQVNGQLVQDVMRWSSSNGYDQINEQATLVCDSRPSWAVEGALIEIRTFINGESCRVFYGEIEGFNWESYAPQVGIECRDFLARTRLEWGGEDRVYTEAEDGAIIQNLVEAMGIPPELTHIESSGHVFGQFDDVIAPSGAAFWPLIEDLDRVTGYRTFTMNGIIYRRRVSGAVSTSARWDYREGVNILHITRHRGRAGIRNRCVVKGVSDDFSEIEQEASAPNPYIPNPPGYITEEIQSNLIEDDAFALEVAERTVSDLNRRDESLGVRVSGNPLMQPGDIVYVVSPKCEAGTAYVRVVHVQHEHTGSSFLTNFTTSGGTLSGYEAGAPAAAMEVKLFLEAEDTGGGAVAKIVGIANGEASHDPDGTIASYAWTLSVDSGTISPTSSTDPVVFFTIDGDPTELTIALTVTDNDGLTDTYTFVQTIDPDALLVEDLWGANGANLLYVAGLIKRTAAVGGGALCTCCAPFALVGWQAFGLDSGHILATFDRLQTAPIDFGAPHGAVAVGSVWIHETATDPESRLWVAFADGQVWFGAVDSAAQSVVWTFKGTLPAADPVMIRESIGRLGELRATAGDSAYYSGDGGLTWSVLLTSATGTAQKMAGGFDTNAVSFAGESSPVQYEEGAAPTFPVLTPPVETIVGLAFGYQDRELYAVDDEQRVFRTGSDLTTFTQTATADEPIYDMIRSGNERGITYFAGDTSIKKGFRGENLWTYVQTGSKVYQLGYGAAHLQTQADASLIVLPKGATGDADKIGFRGSLGWTGKTPPVAGMKWQKIRANPVVPTTLLMLGNIGHGSSPTHLEYSITAGNIVKTYDGSADPLWISHTNGDDWEPVEISSLGLVDDGPYAGGSAVLYLLDIEWSRNTTSKFALLGLRPGDVNMAGVWRGVDGVLGAAITRSTTAVYEGMVAGAGEDLIIPETFYLHKLLYLDAANSYQMPAGDAIAIPYGPAIEHATRRVACIGDGFRLYTWSDYRENQPVDTGQFVDGVSCVIVGGIVYVGSRNGGILAITDAWSGAPPDGTIVAAAGQNIDTIVADAQTHSTMACKRHDTNQYYVYDGSTWSLIDGPPWLDNDHVADTPEIIKQ